MMDEEFYMVLDTETCNADDEAVEQTEKFRDNMPFNVGFSIINQFGKVYEEGSYVIKEVFYDMPVAMSEAFYASKIPWYLEEIANGNIEVISFSDIWSLIRRKCREYNIKAVAAHNAGFDEHALNRLCQYMTKSRYHYFFPREVDILCTMKMAQKTLVPLEAYKEMCNSMGYLTKNNQPRKTAEVVYKFLSGDLGFEEKHTALEDTQIERDIFSYCLPLGNYEDFKLHKPDETPLPQWFTDISGKGSQEITKDPDIIEWVRKNYCE